MHKSFTLLTLKDCPIRGGTLLATSSKSASTPPPRQSAQKSSHNALSVLSMRPASTENTDAPFSSKPNWDKPPV